MSQIKGEERVVNRHIVTMVFAEPRTLSVSECLVLPRSFRATVRSDQCRPSLYSLAPCGGGVRCNGALVGFFP